MHGPESKLLFKLYSLGTSPVPGMHNLDPSRGPAKQDQKKNTQKIINDQ